MKGKRNEKDKGRKEVGMEEWRLMQGHKQRLTES